MYQGAGDDFLGPADDVPLPSEQDGMDFEGEVGVIVDRVPMGTGADQAGTHIKLLVLINDWSLRVLAGRDVKTGFGFLQSKPSTSFGPVAVTPDELGESWRDGRVQLPIHVYWNGTEFGHPDCGQMGFSFAQLIAHAARTRNLSAGTVIGSGTISNDEYRDRRLSLHRRTARHRAHRPGQAADRLHEVRRSCAHRDARCRGPIDLRCHRAARRAGEAAVKVLIIGGEGFIGQALVARLCRGGPIDGRPLPGDGARSAHSIAARAIQAVHYLEGDIADPAVLSRAIEGGVDCVFHLASVPGGAAEQNFELGMRVNLHATWPCSRCCASRCGSVSRSLVFASSIGVYGVPMPAVIDENTIPLPSLSYGAQKLIGEYLVADYGRRGFVDGRSVRIPGIVARPPSTGMLSLFLSDLIRELSAGRRFVCPVEPTARSWLMSRPCIVENLLHAASLPGAWVAQRRTWLLPVQHVSIEELVAAIARRHGPDVINRVSYAPNAALQAQFANYPPLQCPQSEAAGFRHDGTIENLVNRALEPIQ